MGAATVMNVSGMELPKNIIGVLADCGYTSNEDIIKKVIREMHLPAGILYPFARLGGGGCRERKRGGSMDRAGTAPREAHRLPLPLPLREIVGDLGRIGGHPSANGAKVEGKTFFGNFVNATKCHIEMA